MTSGASESRRVLRADANGHKGSLLPEQVLRTSLSRSVVRPGRPRYKAMDLLESESDRVREGTVIRVVPRSNHSSLKPRKAASGILF